MRSYQVLGFEPSGRLAPDWQAQSVLVVAKSGIPHLEKFFGQRGSRRDVDGEGN